MRLSSTVLPLERWISTPMQKLRISSPAISTPCVSPIASPGLVVVRTLAPNWPGTAPAQVRWPLSTTKPDPSIATNSPARFHELPSMRTGPLIGGRSEAGLMTCGPEPGGSISMRKRPGAALLRSIAQRSEPSMRSSPVRVTRSTSTGAVWASAGTGAPSRQAMAAACSGCNCNSSSRHWPGGCTDRRGAARHQIGASDQRIGILGIEEFRTADAGHAAILDAHDRRGDALHLPRMMADIDHRHGGFIAQLQEIREYLALA